VEAKKSSRRGERGILFISTFVKCKVSARFQFSTKAVTV